MITCKGIPQGINKVHLYRVTETAGIDSIFGNQLIKAARGNDISVFTRNIITSDGRLAKYQNGVHTVDKDFVNSLKHNDIISVNEDGVINVLWKAGQEDNLLYLTDCCNSRCVMCPQTQIDKPNNYYNQAIHVLNLIKDNPKFVCISGGEPTFNKESYINVVSVLNKKFPNISLQVLTNGKNFNSFDFCRNAVINTPIDTLYAIPLYSGNSLLHDSVVGSKGSFERTVNGILNLYKLKQNIEIRIVITKDNYKDLNNL